MPQGFDDVPAIRTRSAGRPGKLLGIALWATQILLALTFGSAGFVKALLPVSQVLASGINYATDLPTWLLRFIGTAELAGSVGILLPAITRVAPRLTPLAALGFAAIQILAIGFHAMRGETMRTLPLNLLLLGLAAFVWWGRTNRVVIAVR
jgi:hypothetical protein